MQHQELCYAAAASHQLSHSSPHTLQVVLASRQQFPIKQVLVRPMANFRDQHLRQHSTGLQCLGILLEAQQSGVSHPLDCVACPCCCRKIKSVEFMVCDAIALAAGPLGLKEALGSDGDLQVTPASQCTVRFMHCSEMSDMRSCVIVHERLFPALKP